MGTLLLQNVQQERVTLHSSEPYHGRDICGLIKISNSASSFDNQSEFHCSSVEFDGEIAWKKQRKLIGRDEKFCVVDYKLRPLLIDPHSVETQAVYHVDASDLLDRRIQIER
ncbi:hypothetical protein PTKIN_Ptkin09bG0269600 [Pterospermum kingtungense]